MTLQPPFFVRDVVLFPLQNIPAPIPPDRIQLCFSLLATHSRAKATDNVQPTVQRIEKVLTCCRGSALKINGDECCGARCIHQPLMAHHANNREWRSVDLNLLIQNGGIGTEVASPVALTQNGDIPASVRDVIVRDEQAAQHWLNAEQCEIVSSDVLRKRFVSRLRRANGRGSNRGDRQVFQRLITVPKSFICRICKRELRTATPNIQVTGLISRRLLQQYELS